MYNYSYSILLQAMIKCVSGIFDVTCFAFVLHFLFFKSVHCLVGRTLL